MSFNIENVLTKTKYNETFKNSVFIIYCKLAANKL